MKKNPPAIFLMGPTASGKTALACALSERFPVELISVDSAQIFRGMDIGTAKPSAAELGAYPHHLIDIISPAESYSVARFRADALRLMVDINARGKIPLLVGGTLLYFKGLLEGLADLPPACPATRAEIDRLAKNNGWSFVHTELAKVDPQTAARLAPSDAQRVQRALEVFRLSGQTLSAHFAASSAQALPYRLLSLGFLPFERSVLHQRIGERFTAILHAGLVDEVRTLRQNYDLSLDLPSMRCVGYRQVWEVQDGLAPAHELRERGIYATRQLAKRQMTWMKNTLKPEVFDALVNDSLAQMSLRITQFLAHDR